MSGSANYLSDEVYSEDWVRMTFVFKKKSKQSQIVSIESTLHDEACDPKIGATHVVTEIKTGFNAFLLFESKTTTQTTKKEMGGDLTYKGICGFVEPAPNADHLLVPTVVGNVPRL